VPTTLRCTACGAEYYTAAANVKIEAEHCDACGAQLEITSAAAPRAAATSAGDGDGGRFKLLRSKAAASQRSGRRD
jgi:NAD-dependent SIR2 family protein deacetylase